MLKKYLIASASGLAMLVMTADSARAEPISTAIVVSVFGLAAGSTAAAVASAALTLAISVGLNFAANALFAPPKPPGGAELQVRTGGAQPRGVAFGRVADAGHLVYWNTYGKKNKFLQLVYRLCDWECEGLSAVWVDGRRKTLTSETIPGGNNEAARHHVDGYGSKFVVRWFAGTTTQLADTELVDNANPSGRWTTDHRGRGVCYVSLTLTFDDDLFSGSLPSLVFEYQGAKVYDRRLDDTAGGSGAQRWNDPSTWTWSENPAVCAETFLRGFYRNGVRIHGWGLPEAALSVADLLAAANLSDEALTEGGVGVTRYTGSVVTSEGNEQRQALTAFTEAMGGYFFEQGGTVVVKGGGAETAVATLTEADLTADGDYSYREKLPRSELVNRVSGTFTDPANGWEQVDYPEITSGAWIAEDNGEDLGLDYNLPSVTSGYQAERIARIRANMARLQGRLSIEVLESWLSISAGDWVNYADDKTGPGRTWLVTGVAEQPDRGTLRLELDEVSAAAFEGASLHVPTTAIPADVDAGATTVANLAVSGVKIDQGNGEVPALYLTWTAPDDDTIVGVRFEYNIDAAGAPVQLDQMAEPEAGFYYITDGIVQDTTYQVRATIITDPVRGTTWTGYVSDTTPVITQDVQLVKASIYDTPGGPYSWTKAANPAVDPTNAIVIIESIGGGGGGGHGLQAGGGGGGAYSRFESPYASLPSALDVYVGAGGQGSSGGGSSNADDTLGTGGLSYVVDASDATNVLSAAYGGGPGEGSGTAGNTILGGGGGGLLGAGGPGRLGGAAGELGGGANLSEGVVTPPTFDGGGAAGNADNGGEAVAGGGGGGGSRNFGNGGSSRLSGDGGDGGAATGGAGEDGFAPGGGGGGGDGGTSGGDGARGEVRITVIG